MAKHRTGILGGGFDPVHRAHLRMALFALDGGYVDRVLVIPARDPPNKICFAPSEDRWRMTVAACSVDNRLEPSRVELDRPGPAYAADTLRLLRKEDPKAVFSYIIGSHTLMRLRRWHQADYVKKSCRFLVCPRPENEDIPALREEVIALAEAGFQISFLPMDPMPESSGQIRDREDPPGDDDPSLDISVREYIAAMGLYRREKRIAQAEEWLPQLFDALNPHRFAHSLSVAMTARRLALLHGINPRQAEEAGLLHDCAKCLPLKKMQQIAREHSLTADPGFLESGALLHSLTGAWVARNQYGMADPEVLDAIAYHNTGCPGMSRLAMCVCLADSIEPLRAGYPLLEEVRSLAEKNLEAALLLSLQGTSDYVRNRGKTLHPRTLNTIEWLKKLTGDAGQIPKSAEIRHGVCLKKQTLKNN